MKKDLDHNSTGPAEIEALITRLEQGRPREGDAQLPGRRNRDSRVPCIIVVETTRMRAFISIQIAQDGDSGWSILSR
jgi:hypothetical protein